MSLCPSTSPGALADELTIAAMAKALHDLSARDLLHTSARAHAYLDARIPLHEMYNFDGAALNVEIIRRKACGALEPAPYEAFAQ